MNVVEMSWRQLGSSYGLTISWPVEIEPSKQAEIEQAVHAHGFVSEGDDRWMAPLDPNAPLAMWEAVGQLYAVSTTTARVPPSLLMIAADLQFV
ncbi:hypothetical protein [Rhizobium sp. WYCCWR 11146]|uniref:hypothetical protein n=1 Tax=Rhizobium sp. WYCCWR 11146 TaxID=2749833 RepID=UPI0015E7000B|nr:hypothetical protein [Rhizobium sp. WYCCWR 11146]MBA1343877.1 hypothetical protein [Rhizobium sp. WYCCWR 11146]